MSYNVLGLWIISIMGYSTLGLRFKVERSFRVYHKHGLEVMGHGL
jgi:hypothetical protein